MFSAPPPGGDDTSSLHFLFSSCFLHLSLSVLFCFVSSLQMNPDRRRLRRGETVEVSSPASAGLDPAPRLRERPLGRCHTLDSGERAPDRPQQRAAADTPTAETNDTHSHTDDSSCCSSDSKTSLSPPPPASDSFEAPPTTHNVFSNHSAESDESPDVNGPCDHDDAESPQSSSPDAKDGNSNPTHPSELRPPAHTGGEDASQTSIDWKQEVDENF